ncbi:MAG: hypothetical protein JWO45_581 [Spartobacteria bacterium]|nr:hypothetical protein [Spartobacteria bacterium]
MKSFVARCLAFGLASVVLSLASCDRLSGSKLTLANYNKITTGMSKAQVETILGAPTKVETKDMIIFKKTTYRYEDGKNFAMITFKNDEVDGKETNLTAGSS